MVYCLVSSTKVPQPKLDRRKKSNNENCSLEPLLNAISTSKNKLGWF
jgi:hypothetical protein